MQIRHLRNFLRIAEKGSFSQAAREVEATQSSLSQQIAKLERDLGVVLFNRTTRSVRLTPAGELLLPLAERILDEVDSAQAELDAFGELRRGRLRLGLVRSHGHAIGMVDILSLFERRHPGVELQIATGTSAENINAVTVGTLDVSWVDVAHDEVPSGLATVPWISEPLVLVVPSSHPLGEVAKVDLGQLTQSDRLIRFAQESGLRRRVDEAVVRAGRIPDQGLTIGDVDVIIGLVAGGFGVSVVPRSAVSGSGDAVAVSGVRVLPLADEQAVYEVAVAYNPRRLSPAASGFLKVVNPGWPDGENATAEG